MKLSPKLKQRLRWQNRIFIVLLISVVAAAAWLSANYPVAIDLTQSQNNYPSNETSRVLNSINTGINIKAFVTPGNASIAKDIKLLIEKYQRIKPDIALEIIDPVREPQLVRENNIRSEGEMIVIVGEKTEHISAPTEQQITNALSHLTRDSTEWVLFVEGHDERSPKGETSFDYSAWYKIMRSNGINVRGYNLAQNIQIPDNTQLLVIADPQKKYLEGEVRLIIDYVSKGRNLLWLLEPGDLQGLEALAETLGLEVFSTVVVDPNTQAVGINDLRFTLITEYPSHPITENVKSLSIYPTSTPIEFYGSEKWDASTLLETMPRTWSTEFGVNEITLDSTPSQNGPLTIGISLTRVDASASDFTGESIEADISEEIDPAAALTKSDQRIVVIGDSDFISDAYIGEVGNIDIARNMTNWLIQSENFIDIAPREKQDSYIELSHNMQIIIGFSFLLILPLGLLLTGFLIWRKRRKG